MYGCRSKSVISSLGYGVDEQRLVCDTAAMRRHMRLYKYWAFTCIFWLFFALIFPVGCVNCTWVWTNMRVSTCLPVGRFRLSRPATLIQTPSLIGRKSGNLAAHFHVSRTLLWCQTLCRDLAATRGKHLELPDWRNYADWNFLVSSRWTSARLLSSRGKCWTSCDNFHVLTMCVCTALHACR